MTRVRPATVDDLPAILEISNWAAANTPANFAVEPETLTMWQRDWDDTHEMYPWVVATGATGATDNTILGFAKASPWKGRCAYEWTAEVTVYVHPDHHRRGIAKALYGQLIPTLEAQGYRTLLGGITTPSPASIRLHESFGFRRVALFERVGWKFDQWHDVGYWEAILGDADESPASIKPVSEVIAERSAIDS